MALLLADPLAPGTGELCPGSPGMRQHWGRGHDCDLQGQAASRERQDQGWESPEGQGQEEEGRQSGQEQS